MRRPAPLVVRSAYGAANGDATSNPLSVGDRVTMSGVGVQRHPAYIDRQGVIVGVGSPNSLRVKFDNRVCVQSIHRTYLQRVR